MFGSKTDYKLADLVRDLEAALTKARASHVNKHAVENALEQMLNVHRAYIASTLR
jgi:hypothetical protein